jgi:hydrogenase maturation protease
VSDPAAGRPAGPAPVLVLGIGNELLTDEGVGVFAARRLAERAPPGVDVLPAGTLGLQLLTEIVGRHAVLVLDAVMREGLAPGDIVVLDVDEVPADAAPGLSVHQLDVTDALRVAELAGGAPARATVVGIVPASLGPGVGLSDVVAARLDDLLAEADRVLAGWGVPARA